MSEDSKLASIKRVMDNPGLAFLKQMHDPQIYALVYGKDSALYHEALKMSPVEDKTNSLTVFMEQEVQLSIERHYLLPKSIDPTRLYFLVFVLLRDRFVSFFYSLYLGDWERLTYIQKRWFDNKLFIWKRFRETFEQIHGKEFWACFGQVLKRIDFKEDVDGEEDFKKVYQMSRLELICEFELFMGRAPHPASDQKPDPNHVLKRMKIDPNRDADAWLDSIELMAEEKRLFKLGVTPDIKDLDNKQVQYFGKERENLMSWVGDAHLVISLNKSWIIGAAMRLKKCTKITFDIRTSRNVSLNDCLSTVRPAPNRSLLPQRRVPPARQPVVLFALQRAPQRVQENLAFPDARDPHHPPQALRQKHQQKIRYFPQNK